MLVDKLGPTRKKKSIPGLVKEYIFGKFSNRIDVAILTNFDAKIQNKTMLFLLVMNSFVTSPLLYSLLVIFTSFSNKNHLSQIRHMIF